MHARCILDREERLASEYADPKPPVACRGASE